MPIVFRLGKILLIMALLLVMPLQGVAAALSHVLCSSAAEQTLSGHYHDAGDNSIAPHDHNDDNSGNNHASHLSCHHASPAMSSVTATIFASDPPVFEPAIFFFPSLFFPEQPQRPPLA